MHLYKKKKRIPYAGALLTLLAFACTWGYSLYGFGNISESLASRQREALLTAIDRAVISCYAVEGYYPPDIQYLQEHYGVVIDEEKYEVSYLAQGGNKKPKVQVLLRGGAQE